MIDDFVTPTNECPYCGHPFDRAMSTKGDEGPEAGDFTVCISCAKVSIFKEDRTVRALTLDEKERAANLPWLTQVQMMVAKISKGRFRKQRKKR